MSRLLRELERAGRVIRTEGSHDLACDVDLPASCRRFAELAQFDAAVATQDFQRWLLTEAETAFGSMISISRCSQPVPGFDLRDGRHHVAARALPTRKAGMEIRVVGIVPVSSFGHDAVSDFRQPSVEHSAAFAEDVRRAAGEDVRESGQPLRVPGKRLPDEEQLSVSANASRRVVVRGRTRGNQTLT